MTEFERHREHALAVIRLRRSRTVDAVLFEMVAPAGAVSRLTALVVLAVPAGVEIWAPRQSSALLGTLRWELFESVSADTAVDLGGSAEALVLGVRGRAQPLVLPLRSGGDGARSAEEIAGRLRPLIRSGPEESKQLPMVLPGLSSAQRERLLRYTLVYGGIAFVLALTLRFAFPSDSVATASLAPFAGVLGVVGVLAVAAPRLGSLIVNPRRAAEAAAGYTTDRRFYRSLPFVGPAGSATRRAGVLSDPARRTAVVSTALALTVALALWFVVGPAPSPSASTLRPLDLGSSPAWGEVGFDRGGPALRMTPIAPWTSWSASSLLDESTGCELTTSRTRTPGTTEDSDDRGASLAALVAQAGRYAPSSEALPDVAVRAGTTTVPFVAVRTGEITLAGDDSTSIVTLVSRTFTATSITVGATIVCPALRDEGERAVAVAGALANLELVESDSETACSPCDAATGISDQPR